MKLPAYYIEITNKKTEKHNQTFKEYKNKNKKARLKNKTKKNQLIKKDKNNNI